MEARSPGKIIELFLKIEHWHVLINNGLCLHARSCTVHVTIFSNSLIIPPGFKFTELHALTLAAHSYALLDTVTTIYMCFATRFCAATI